MIYCKLSKKSEAYFSPTSIFSFPKNKINFSKFYDDDEVSNVSADFWLKSIKCGCIFC